MPSGTDHWRERHAAIAEILRDEVIHSQSELLRQLRKRKHRVTQPSISRDLAELDVVKVDGRYVLRESLVPPEPSRSELEQAAGFVRSFEPAGPNLVVLKTPPGAASQVAIAIDGEGWQEVVGTIAGDDTVFIATRGRSQQARLETLLKQVMGGIVHA